MDEPNTKIKLWLGRVTKYSMGIAVALVATYAALRPEEVARRAVTRIEVSHHELSNKVVDVQKWVRANQISSKEAVESCKAEVAALTSFVTGYLMGLNKGSGTNNKRSNIDVDSSSIKSLVDTLGGQSVKSTSQTTILPKLNRPSSVQHLLDRKNK